MSEKTTLVNCNVQLVKCISRAPKDIADRLKAFLSPEDERFIAHQMHDDAEKARRIIAAVNTRLDFGNQEKKTRVFLEFVEALHSTGLWTKDLVEALEDEYKSLTGTALNKGNGDRAEAKRTPHNLYTIKLTLTIINSVTINEAYVW